MKIVTSLSFSEKKSSARYRSVGRVLTALCKEKEKKKEEEEEKKSIVDKHSSEFTTVVRTCIINLPLSCPNYRVARQALFLFRTLTVSLPRGYLRGSREPTLAGALKSE